MTDPSSVARTPPMGWNSWNPHGPAVTAADVRDAADALVATGLRDVGYEYVVVDDCWMAPETADDGRLLAHPETFPDGIADLAAYVHDRGLKLGLYSSAGTETCQGRPASLERERLHAAQFAEWGVDYLKYDNCGDHRGRDALSRYAAMGRALRDLDRTVVYGICDWGTNDPWLWGRNAGGHLWRTTDDVVAKWQTTDGEFGLGILDVVDRTAALGIAGYHGPSGWNDPDMLQVGNGPDSGQSRHEAVDVGRPLTRAESRSHVAFWCLLAAPLFAGTDLAAVDDADLELLSNNRLVAIDQDPLGLQGTPDRRGEATEVWSKRLANGGGAVALLNRGRDVTEIAAGVEDVDVPTTADRYRVCDCWTGETWETAGDLAATVVPRDTAVRRVTPLS
jgi:alpha-galactosidase